MPDDELLTLAEQGRLREPAVLEKQVRRMVADPKSAAFIENFAGQWLNLRALATVAPNPSVYPDFDDNLRVAFRREVELLFDAIVQEDRSVLDLLNADYTFVDERLAKHYGIRERLRQPVPARQPRPGSRDAAGAAREGRLDARDVAGHEDLAGHPRQGVPGNLPRRESSVPAAGRADDQGTGAGQHRQYEGTDHARAHGDAPRERVVFELSQPVRADRARARELRWRRRLAAQGRRPADRPQRRARERHQDRWRGEPAESPDAELGAVRRVSSRKSCSPTRWAAAWTIRTCPWCAPSRRGAAAGDYRFSALVLGVVKSEPFQNNMKGAEAALQTAAR